ncbi:MAG: hypothetical protein DMG06_23820, partial [Acidobacteria bacterium]
MKRKGFHPHGVLVLLLFLVGLIQSNLWAQVDRGGIVGTVSDSSGAVVPGVTVTITNVGTNQSTKLSSDVNGSYAANLLHIVTYSVTAEKEGFQKTIQSNVEVG